MVDEKELRVFLETETEGVPDRQLDGLFISLERTQPLAYERKDSWSFLLVPTIPICGKVKVIICFAYEGSVRISW